MIHRIPITVALIYRGTSRGARTCLAKKSSRIDCALLVNTATALVPRRDINKFGRDWQYFCHKCDVEFGQFTDGAQVKFRRIVSKLEA